MKLTGSNKMINRAGRMGRQEERQGAGVRSANGLEKTMKPLGSGIKPEEMTGTGDVGVGIRLLLCTNQRIVGPNAAKEKIHFQVKQQARWRSSGKESPYTSGIRNSELKLSRNKSWASAGGVGQKRLGPASPCLSQVVRISCSSGRSDSQR